MEDEKTEGSSQRLRRKWTGSSGFLSRVDCVFCPASLGAPLLAAAPPAALPIANQPSLYGCRRSERRPHSMFVILLLLIPPWEAGVGAAGPREVLFLTLDACWDSVLSSSSSSSSSTSSLCRKSSLLPWKLSRRHPAPLWQMSPA